MSKFRGLDTDIGWQKREFKKVWAAIREGNAAKRLASSTVGDSGNLLVRGILKVIGSLDLTGTMSMKTADGIELARMGDVDVGRGVEWKRDDGSYAVRFHKVLGNPYQSLELYDNAGKVILGEGGLGAGLFRPSLPYPFQPVAATSGTVVTCGPWGIERSTTSATFETLFVWEGKAQNPNVDIKLAVICSDGTTAGEAQMVNLATGLPLSAFLASPWLGAIPTGSTSFIFLDPTQDQALTPAFSGNFAAAFRVGIQVRRTAGSGTITVAVPSASG